MGAVIVQVSTDRNDHFMEVEESVLRELAERVRAGGDDKELLRQVRQDFWKAASSAKVSSTDECDYDLVLDGFEDHNSWLELLEAWDGDPDA
jgi:hypothetical protein